MNNRWKNGHKENCVLRCTQVNGEMEEKIETEFNKMILNGERLD